MAQEQVYAVLRSEELVPDMEATTEDGMYIQFGKEESVEPVISVGVGSVAASAGARQGAPRSAGATSRSTAVGTGQPRRAGGCRVVATAAGRGGALHFYNSPFFQKQWGRVGMQQEQRRYGDAERRRRRWGYPT